MKWSKNFNKEEYEKTNYSIHNQLEEGKIEYLNFYLLNDLLLQPLRDYLNKPIYINSGYRCEELNNLVKGVKNSQHLGIKGAAADIIVKDMSSEQLLKVIVSSGLNYDQLINEKGLNSDWIHISFNYLHNRKQILVAKQNSDKTFTYYA